MSEQQSLFGHEESSSINISGLSYISNYITKEQEKKLLQNIDKGEWLTELRRRVQHFGYKYDYHRGRPLKSLGKLPSWTHHLTKRFVDELLTTQKPDQLIVNEYMPGQGISAHVDREDQFDEIILSLSLGSSVVMDFIKKSTKQKMSVLLEPLSLVILQGEARHEWTHAIPARLSDEWRGEKKKRDRRVSLTFRKVRKECVENTQE